MVRHDVFVVRELFLADCTFPALVDDLSVKQFPHFCWRPEFPIPSWVMRILNAPYTKLYRTFLTNLISATAEDRSMDSAVSHSGGVWLGFLRISLFGETGWNGSVQEGLGARQKSASARGPRLPRPARPARPERSLKSVSGSALTSQRLLAPVCRHDQSHQTVFAGPRLRATGRGISICDRSPDRPVTGPSGRARDRASPAERARTELLGKPATRRFSVSRRDLVVPQMLVLEPSTADETGLVEGEHFTLVSSDAVVVDSADRSSLQSPGDNRWP